jgi:hypothetical protein
MHSRKGPASGIGAIRRDFRACFRSDDGKSQERGRTKLWRSRRRICRLGVGQSQLTVVLPVGLVSLDLTGTQSVSLVSSCVRWSCKPHTVYTKDTSLQPPVSLPQSRRRSLFQTSKKAFCINAREHKMQAGGSHAGFAWVAPPSHWQDPGSPGGRTASSQNEASEKTTTLALTNEAMPSVGPESVLPTIPKPVRIRLGAARDQQPG